MVHPFLSFFFFFFFLILVVLGLNCCIGFPSCGDGRYSLVAVRGLLIIVSSLVEHGPQGVWASVVADMGSIVTDL